MSGKTLVEVFADERKDQLANMVHDLPRAELITLRAIINGKLSKRHITPEQQEMMKAAKAAKKLLTTT